MCLGIPGQVVALHDTTDQLAKVDIAGVTRDINLGLVLPDGVTVGDWVLVHMGFAMSVIDADEAETALEGLRLLGQEEPDGDVRWEIPQPTIR